MEEPPGDASGFARAGPCLPEVDEGLAATVKDMLGDARGAIGGGDQSRGPSLFDQCHALDFLLGRFPRQHTASIVRETRLMAIALLDDHWDAVRRLVEALCRRPLPTRLPGPMVERIVARQL